MTWLAYSHLGVAKRLTLDTQPGGALAGIPFVSQPVGRLLDGSGVLSRTTGTVVTVSKLSGAGTLSGTLTAVTVEGVFTFTDLKMDTVTGTVVLQFNAPGLVSVDSNSFNVTQPNTIIGCEVGTYTVTGTAQTLTRGPYMLRQDEVGSYAITGTAATLTYSGTVVYFQDGFESGNLLSPTVALSGWSWGDTNIDGGYILAPSTIRAYTGSYSLRFQFKPGPYPDDSWAEQRFWMGGNLTENYVRFQIYIPTNYEHRNTPSSDNNKFWRQWCTTYSQTELGSSLVATNDADPLAGSDLILERCDFYHAMGPDGMPTVVGFISPSDFGTWIDVQMYFKLGADVGGAGARMIVWKNGVSVADTGSFVNDPASWPNRFTAGYMLGYSNSGFDNLTELYIDNVTFSNTSAY